MIFQPPCPSPSLEDHGRHHAHEHDGEDWVVELHGAFERKEQHTRNRLDCDHCD